MSDSGHHGIVRRISKHTPAINVYNLIHLPIHSSTIYFASPTSPKSSNNCVVDDLLVHLIHVGCDLTDIASIVSQAIVLVCCLCVFGSCCIWRGSSVDKQGIGCHLAISCSGLHGSILLSTSKSFGRRIYIVRIRYAFYHEIFGDSAYEKAVWMP